MTIDESFKVYKKVTIQKSTEDRALVRTSIRNNALFKDFTDGELELYVDVFAPQSHKAGSTVIQQGDVGNTFYVVQSGALEIFINMGPEKGETLVGVPYRRGGAFGELALLYESPRAATIRASEDTELWVITRTAFKGLQLHMEQEKHQSKIEHLQNVKIGKKKLGQVMDQGQLESMSLATQYQKFDAGSTIVREGEKGNTFYIITKGHVDVYKQSAGTDAIASLGANSFFGEKALSSADTRQATCVAAKNTECLTLSRDDFNMMLGNLDDLLAGRRYSVLNQSTVLLPSTAFQLEDKEETNLSFRDLKIKRVLGEGAFGKVNLVKSKVDGRIFALKAQAKATVVKSGSQLKLVTEYMLMKELQHPFIVECFQSFQDKRYIFFLMGLLPGGELLDLLDEHEKFPESWCQFYCGTVVLVFEFMHQQKIAYRDLKPENLVLDAEGFCHVVDLGLAKRCDTGKTWTMCGTPDYLAPEIIKGKGHDWGVDYWALGVLLYELAFGDPPFYDENPSNTAKKVMKGTYDIPQHFSRPLVDLISRLLTHPSKRLGRVQGGVRKIRKHAWFSDFDFHALLGRDIQVPFVPQIENIEKLGTKDEGQWGAPECDWWPQLDDDDRQPSTMKGTAKAVMASRRISDK